MVNFQTRIQKGLPPFGPVEYGIRVTAKKIPLGIPRVADGPSSGDKWASATNLLGFLYGGSWVECSFTYVKSISGLSEGWYFWYTWSGGLPGTYQSLGFNPENDNVTFTLHNSNGQWLAYFHDITKSILRSYTITGAPNTIIDPDKHPAMMIESVHDECAYYDQFNQVDWDNFKYLDQYGNEIAYNPGTFDSDIPFDLRPCLAADEIQDRIYHK